MHTITSLHSNLLIDPEQGWFCLFPADERLPVIQKARISLTYRINNRKQKILDQTWKPLLSTEQSSQEDHLNCLSGPHPGGLMCHIEFALLSHFPFPVWRIHLENQGSDILHIEQIELLNVGGQSHRGSLDFSDSAQSDSFTFYSNGWQSWSPTRAYPAHQAMKISRLGRFQVPMILNAGTPAIRQPGYFSSDFFGVISNQRSQSGLLAGFLSQRQHFGSLEAILYDRLSLRLWASGDHTRLDPGTTMTTDWALGMPFSLQERDPLAPYLEAVAHEHAVKMPQSIPSGWCSWYHYYTNVSAENIRENMQSMVAKRQMLPLDLVQIDDGFEAQVGDWFDFKPTFPDGVAGLADKIKAHNLTPGLWLAPFIVHPKAELVRQHPEYLLRNNRGRPVNAGFVWNTFTQALDLTIPEVLAYACKTVSTAAHEWGYPYLKLDFLYAGALAGCYHDPTRTRAQVLRQSMQALREAAGPDTFLLGCGAPLGSVLGLVEAMRIGADVSGSWEPEFKGIRYPFKNELAFPCARNSIQNILTRAPLHRRWWINDPDCLLVRPDTDLSLAEVQSLATAIGLTGGSLLLSDDLPALPEERLRIAQVLLPVMGLRAEVIDLLDGGMPQFLRLDLDGAIGKWHLIARFNWQNRPMSWQFNPDDFKLPRMDYDFSSFWDQASGKAISGSAPVLAIIPPHGVSLLALYPHHDQPIQYSGSNLHISQGCEVTGWRASANELALTLDLQHSFSGYFDLWLPDEPVSAAMGQQVIRWENKPDERFRFSVQSDNARPVDINIRLKN